MVVPDSLTKILDALDGVRRSGKGYVARCPAHDDRSPSLSVGVGEGGRVLVRCFAGCPTPEIVGAVGLAMTDLFPADERRGQGRYAGFAATAKRIGRDLPLTNKIAPTPDPRLAGLAERAWRRGRKRLPILADELGVNAVALDALQCGWATAGDLADLDTRCRSSGAWAFPMRDATGTVIGVRLRSPGGFKYSVKGGRQGLFAPRGIAFKPGDPLFVCEGPTDAAALLTLGLMAVGLPSAGQGGDLLLALVRRAKPGRVLILADDDTAGEQGALTIARFLARGGVACRVASVPGGAKDARAFVNAGGGRAGLLALLDAEAKGVADAE